MKAVLLIRLVRVKEPSSVHQKQNKLQGYVIGLQLTLGAGHLLYAVIDKWNRG